ncbi:unnamed protein product [Closterium sp. NIES-64]|nr:unnamed protein product [Closterium sp. NIES-64]
MDPREIVTVDEAMARTVWSRRAAARKAAGFASASATASAAAAAAVAVAGGSGARAIGAGDGVGAVVATGASDSADQQLPIKYHGGKLMTRPITVYVIFYGSWRKSQMRIVKNFIHSLSNTTTTPSEENLARVADWWRINTWYTQKGRKRVTSQVRLGGSVRDRYSLGKDVSNDMQGVWNILSFLTLISNPVFVPFPTSFPYVIIFHPSPLTVVAAQLANRTFPRSSRAQYLVLSSADVRFGSSRPNSGFCRTYCGWHSYAEVSRKILKFAFVGNAEEQCPSGCRRGFGMRGSANGWRGVDGMVSIVGHEIAEAATNPVFTRGWFDDEGQENADKCQVRGVEQGNGGRGGAGRGGAGGEGQEGGRGGYVDFGPSSSIRTVGDRYAYNMVGQGGMRWLIQSNWRPGGEDAGCVLRGPSESEVAEWAREERARNNRKRGRRKRKRVSVRGSLAGSPDTVYVSRAGLLSGVDDRPGPEKSVKSAALGARVGREDSSSTMHSSLELTQTSLVIQGGGGEGNEYEGSGISRLHFSDQHGPSSTTPAPTPLSTLPVSPL